MEEEAYIFGCHKDDIDPYHKVTLLSTELDNSNDDSTKMDKTLAELLHLSSSSCSLYGDINFPLDQYNSILLFIKQLSPQ